MSLLYLTKATLVCGGSAFLIYSFPVISQAVIISILAFLWFSCALRTIQRARRQQVANKLVRGLTSAL